LNKNGCPTLVVRTQAHDGYEYQEDPKIFTAFFVWLLEQGRREYGVGTHTQICVLLDRGPVMKNGKRKIEKLDMGVVPKLVELFKMLFSTINNNYPDLLLSAKVVPVSFFFSMCYKITSRAMDAKNRSGKKKHNNCMRDTRTHTYIDYT